MNKIGDTLIRPPNMSELSKFQIRSGITEFLNKFCSYRKDTLESMTANKPFFFLFTNFLVINTYGQQRNYAYCNVFEFWVTNTAVKEMSFYRLC